MTAYTNHRIWHAEIFGGGPNAFSRYERGETTPLRSTSNLLRLLNNHPEQLAELLKYHGS